MSPSKAISKYFLCHVLVVGTFSSAEDRRPAETSPWSSFVAGFSLSRCRCCCCCFRERPMMILLCNVATMDPNCVAKVRSLDLKGEERILLSRSFELLAIVCRLSSVRRSLKSRSLRKPAVRFQPPIRFHFGHKLHHEHSLRDRACSKRPCRL